MSKKISRLHFMFKHLGIDLTDIVRALEHHGYIEMISDDRFIELKKINIKEVSNEILKEIKDSQY
jgi:hypothetical protein